VHAILVGESLVVVVPLVLQCLFFDFVIAPSPDVDAFFWAQVQSVIPVEVSLVVVVVPPIPEALLSDVEVLLWAQV